jgi:hypothetical protein
VQYLERLPSGLVPDKDRLIEEIRLAEEQAKQEGQEQTEIENHQ